MGRRRHRRKISSATQLLIGVGLPLLIFVGLIQYQHRGQAKRRALQQAAFYWTLTNAVTEHLKGQTIKRFVEPINLRTELARTGSVGFTGWAEVANVAERQYFEVDFEEQTLDSENPRVLGVKLLSKPAE